MSKAKRPQGPLMDAPRALLDDYYARQGEVRPELRKGQGELFKLKNDPPPPPTMEEDLAVLEMRQSFQVYRRDAETGEIESWGLPWETRELASKYCDEIERRARGRARFRYL